MLIYTVSTSLDGLPTARNGIPVRSDLVPGHAVELGCRIRVQGRGSGPVWGFVPSIVVGFSRNPESCLVVVYSAIAALAG